MKAYLTITTILSGNHHHICRNIAGATIGHVDKRIARHVAALERMGYPVPCWDVQYYAIDPTLGMSTYTKGHLFSGPTRSTTKPRYQLQELNR
jgi:hypothetical protein